MRRRDFLTRTVTTIGAAAFPRLALAQAPAKLPRIAFLWPPGELPEWIAAWQQGLADYGYINGKTITTETFAAQSFDDYPGFAAKIVASKPDLVLVQGGLPALAVRSLTTTIPIVVAAIDPVGEGLVKSLAHPGGNITGMSFINPEVAGKVVQIAKEIIPAMTRIVALNEPANPPNAPNLEQLRIQSKALGIEVIVVDFVDGLDFTHQFDRVVAAAPPAIYVAPGVYFPANRELLSDLQIKYKLPLFWPTPATNPRAMVGYGPTTTVTIRKTGAYVDAILKGAKPADLPIEQPNIYDLSINLVTAKAIGIPIPVSILAQATIVVGQ